MDDDFKTPPTPPSPPPKTRKPEEIPERFLDKNDGKVVIPTEDGLKSRRTGRFVSARPMTPARMIEKAKRRFYKADVIGFMGRVIEGRYADARIADRIRASEYLWERAFGKVPDAHAVLNLNGPSQSLSTETLTVLARKLAETAPQPISYEPEDDPDEEQGHEIIDAVLVPNPEDD